MPQSRPRPILFSRIGSLKQLSTLPTGHSIAEEAALYPALAKVEELGHATKAYTQQSAAKLQMWSSRGFAAHEPRILGQRCLAGQRIRRLRSLVYMRRAMLYAGSIK